MGEFLLIGIVILPAVLGVTFRVATTHIFFALMAGELLGRYFGHDLTKQAASDAVQQVSPSLGEVALIIAPMVLTAVFLRGTLSKGKVLLHIVPLLVTGIITAAFVLPLLPEAIQTEVSGVPAGKWLLDMNRWIIGGMVVLQLLSLWFMNRKKNERTHQIE